MTLSLSFFVLLCFVLDTLSDIWDLGGQVLFFFVFLLLCPFFGLFFSAGPSPASCVMHSD